MREVFFGCGRWPRFYRRSGFALTDTISAVPSARPELLSPAGDWDCLRAAIENGADAVYFGLECGFNARMRAANFSLDELPAILALLHRRGLRGYVTLNTLIFPGEMPGVESVLRQIARAGTDALLVQDLGLARLAKRVCPDLSLHASTQMTLTSAEGIEAARELGIDRVVAARELSLDEIRRIRRQTDMPLEVFVHGALCVAYSGQCLTSESLGGRSANRGVCAQACRLPYELVCDGRDVDLGDQEYLLSPQDLAAYALVPDLVAAGVAALKIEGRLKKPEYVANITHHYRRAIDAAVAGRPMDFTRQQIEEMELAFSRGFSPGWLLGNDHKRLVPALSSAKRGVRLGQVTAVVRNRVHVRLGAALCAGDGLVFEGNRASGQEQGGRVFAIYRAGGRINDAASGEIVELVFARESVDVGQLSAGLSVWKTDDPRLTRRWRSTFESNAPRRRVPVDILVRAAVGQPLHIIAQAANGATCSIQSESPLEPAIQHPLTRALLERQLGRLGGTVYELRDVTPDIQGTPMAPLSVLGQLRHEMVRQLDASLEQSRPRRVANEEVLPGLRAEITAAAAAEEDSDRPAEPPQLHVLCRSLEQVEAALEADALSLMVDFQDIRQYRSAVVAAHRRGARILLATPRIQKPGETGIFRVLLRHGADGLLVRNLAGLRFCREQGVAAVADYSLNAANELTANYLRQCGAQRVTASYDLNRDQLLELVRAVPSRWLEVVLHQHMPLFHMEHCVFCAVLSPGTNKTNCGRPCDRHRVALRDRVGVEHILQADVGCRNTLFNATAQSGAEVAYQLVVLGVRHFRIELVEESADRLRKTIHLYRQLLAGQSSGKQVWRELQAANRIGVTRGTLEQRRDPLAIL